MKSRHKKHLKRIISKSPIIVFSNNKYNKGEIVFEVYLPFCEKINNFSRASSLIDFNSSNSLQIKRDMKNNLKDFIELYLPIYNYAYVLIPINHSECKVVDKFDISIYRNLNQKIIINSETLYDVKCDYKKIQNDIIKSFNKYSKLKL